MQCDTVCVILAGGKGKRMRSKGTHKVCFPVGGVPAIVRTVGIFKSAGVKQFIIVVGTMAEQVLSTVAEVHPDVSFVYQANARGTGHAAGCAVDVLKAAGFDGNVLITMGDKVVQPAVVNDLIENFTQADADLTLAALPKDPVTTAGRIVTDAKGEALGIVEVADIRRAIETRTKISLPGQAFSGSEIEKKATRVNGSLYIFRAKMLYEALDSLQDDNAQGELYLTDTIEFATRNKCKVTVFDVANPNDLMAYNTPEELLKIEEICSKRQAGKRDIAAGKPKLNRGLFRPASEWLKMIETNSPKLQKALSAIYGKDPAVLEERKKTFADVLKLFIKNHSPDRLVILVRAPGRINLMGRHVDHRGGFVNVMAINREVVMAAALREDDNVTLRNVNRKEFPDSDFRIGELLGQANWVDWMDYINSTTVRQVLQANRGDWSNYAKAAVLRLQHACPRQRLKGMDCAMAGDIPMSAGLSSSSAIVVACAESALALNGLDINMQEFVDLCGEGEWFVGSRGGSADHAAIRSGKRERVARLGFFPFRVEKSMPFPKGMFLVIANSHVKASKSAGARDTFNHRVASYRLAEMLMKERSAILKSMEHLRDINPNTLGVSPVEIYRIIQRLPETITRRGAMRLLKDHHEKLEEIFATHSDIGPYRLRDVAMFGISECMRSDMFAEVLEQGHLEQIGRMMKISHDGDRVVQYREGWAVKFAPSYSDGQLKKLIQEAGNEDPLRQANADLWLQPGRYACSTEEIDYLVDLACAQKGVIGSQITGAGLGGCAMILVREECLDPLLSVLKKNYYQPRRLKPDLHVCRPVTGSGVLKI